MPSLHADLATRLASISDSPALDASVLLAHILNQPRSWVIAHPELSLAAQQQNILNESVSRLENGEPLPYILGHWEFFGLQFEVTPDVLIPRPETELLVERAIAWLRESSNRKYAADVGTGSGIIAISLAVNLPDIHVLATDLSPEALQVAKRNAERHHVHGRIQFFECDLLPEHAHRHIDLLCANLPYIPTATLHDLPVYKKEPALALDGGADGFALIRRLMQRASEYLSSETLMLFEIEATLGKQALSLANEILPETTARLHQDSAGRDRLLEIKKSS